MSRIEQVRNAVAAMGLVRAALDGRTHRALPWGTCKDSLQVGGAE